MRFLTEIFRTQILSLIVIIEFKKKKRKKKEKRKKKRKVTPHAYHYQHILLD